MKILQYEDEKKAEILAESLVTLMSGGTIVYPTETSYAVGADFFSPAACTTVYKMKRRKKGEHLSVIVPNLTYATSLVRFSPRAIELAQHYWPGPLTLVLPFLYSKDWPHHGDDFLALRVSSHPFAHNLAQSFGKPLTATSANISGMPNSYTVDEFLDQLKDSTTLPDLVIDAGKLPKHTPSTIIKDSEGKFELLRKGEVVIPA